MTVHAYLVTGDDQQRVTAWMASCTYANWLEGRELPAARETWQVMVMDAHSGPFLDACRAAGVTVQEIHGSGDDETYELLIGADGTGWPAPDDTGPR